MDNVQSNQTQQNRDVMGEFPSKMPIELQNSTLKKNICRGDASIPRDDTSE
jgi:hypothetical protein